MAQVTTTRMGIGWARARAWVSFPEQWRCRLNGGVVGSEWKVDGVCTSGECVRLAATEETTGRDDAS